jgi:excisionase family DNA binding protein
MEETSRYLTTPTCATYIGRTVAAVRGLVKRGQIPCVRVGRRVQFDKERIDRWMNRKS